MGGPRPPHPQETSLGGVLPRYHEAARLRKMGGSTPPPSRDLSQGYSHPQGGLSGVPNARLCARTRGCSCKRVGEGSLDGLQRVLGENLELLLFSFFTIILFLLFIQYFIFRIFVVILHWIAWHEYYYSMSLDWNITCCTSSSSSSAIYFQFCLKKTQ